MIDKKVYQDIAELQQVISKWRDRTSESCQVALMPLPVAPTARHFGALADAKNRYDLAIVQTKSEKIAEVVSHCEDVDCVLIDSDLPQIRAEGRPGQKVFDDQIGADIYLLERGSGFTCSDRPVTYYAPEEGERTRLPDFDGESEDRPPWCHLFWSGESFTLSRYLAVLSALRVHRPENGLILWTKEPPDDPKWRALEQMDDIEVKDGTSLISDDLLDRWSLAFDKVRENLTSYHAPAEIVHVKDMVMWASLYKYGGIFLDIDTISVKPVWDRVDRKGLYTGGIPATGVLLATKKAEAVEWIMKWINSAVEELPNQDDWHQWCFFGPVALGQCDMQTDKSIYSLDPNTFYYLHNDLDKFFDENRVPKLPDETSVLHYYGEGRREMPSNVDPCQKIDKEFIKSSNSLYGRVARNILTEGDPIVNLPEDFSGPTRLGEGDQIKLQPTKDQSSISVTRPEKEINFVLTAIMKDEKGNIEEALGSVAPIVDRWILCDTGSEDGTIQKCRQFFEKRDIPQISEDQVNGYKIYEISWKGFKTSRQEALELAIDHTDDNSWIMKLDLDERLKNPEALRRAAENGDVDILHLYCYQGSRDSVRFAFPRAWHISTNPHYEGGDHEVVGFESDQHGFLDPDESGCWVLHYGGARGAKGLFSTVRKLKRDIDIAASKAKRDPRAEFYLGRDITSYDLQEGEYWLERRCNYSGNSFETQEKFFALLYLGDNLAKQGRNEMAVRRWEQAADLYREASRAREPRHRIAELSYQIADKLKNEDKEEAGRWWRKAYRNYKEALEIESEPNMTLFVECGKYSGETTGQMAWKAAIALVNLRQDEKAFQEALDLTENVEGGKRLEQSRRTWASKLQQ